MTEKDTDLSIEGFRKEKYNHNRTHLLHKFSQHKRHVQLFIVCNQAHNSICMSTYKLLHSKWFLILPITRVPRKGLILFSQRGKYSPPACRSFLTLWDHVKLALLPIKASFQTEKQALCLTGSDFFLLWLLNCVHACLFLSLVFPNILYLCGGLQVLPHQEISRSTMELRNTVVLLYAAHVSVGL